MFKWLHHLLNPHCPECQDEKQIAKICSSCETLKAQLAIANHEKERLIELIVHPLQNNTANFPEVKPELITPKVVPWKVRQQQLETDDREKARLMRAKEKEATELRMNKPSQSVQELEKELGIVEEKNG
jgi:hypothetical protein